jgi:hypothetical protein
VENILNYSSNERTKKSVLFWSSNTTWRPNTKHRGRTVPATYCGDRAVYKSLSEGPLYLLNFVVFVSLSTKISRITFSNVPLWLSFIFFSKQFMVILSSDATQPVQLKKSCQIVKDLKKSVTRIAEQTVTTKLHVSECENLESTNLYSRVFNKRQKKRWKCMDWSIILFDMQTELRYTAVPVCYTKLSAYLLLDRCKYGRIVL